MGNSYFMVQISKFSLIFRKTITFEYKIVSERYDKTKQIIKSFLMKKYQNGIT
jgi:hypothetical protein